MYSNYWIENICSFVCTKEFRNKLFLTTYVRRRRSKYFTAIYSVACYYFIGNFWANKGTLTLEISTYIQPLSDVTFNLSVLMVIPH